jgi:hypothetical protein
MVENEKIIGISWLFFLKVRLLMHWFQKYKNKKINQWHDDNP